jgi:two-component system, sensor histidine kinase and response regulator
MSNSPERIPRADLLIIDDTPENLNLLSAVLSKQGYKVRCVTKGSAGIRGALAAPPDLILLDINMPVMNGYEVCQRLKAEAKTQEIPVIFISALDDVLDKVQAFTAGAVDYITKPFQVEEVLARVETHLTLRSLQQQLQAQNAQLQQQMLELQELNRLKDEFLHAISHDLRTPIMGTLMVLKNLQSQSGDMITIPRSILERMSQSGDRQLNLLNSLLEAHAGDLQGLHLDYQPLQLSVLVHSLYEELEPLLRKSQALFINQVSPELPLVLADSLQLRRVFENLIINALNHNPPGVHLTLQAQRQEDMIHCTVEDDGVGLDPDQREHLFERYVRGSRARSTGIGLGLYLCRQIITAHGGQIGAMNSPGAGTTFWFTLPLATSIPRQNALESSLPEA